MTAKLDQLENEIDRIGRDMEAEQKRHSLAIRDIERQLTEAYREIEDLRHEEVTL